MNWLGFSWRGKRIDDIHKWAEERGERMVKVKETRTSPYGVEIEVLEMPESFANNMCVYEGGCGSSVRREVIE
jgi:hypothetical protein